MRRRALLTVLATSTLALGAARLHAETPPAVRVAPGATLPTYPTPHVLTAGEVAALHQQLRAAAVMQAQKNGQPAPAPASSAPAPWQSPVVLSPAQPVDAATGSHMIFWNALLVDAKYAPYAKPAAFLNPIDDFNQDSSLPGNWNLLGPTDSGIEVELRQLGNNQLYAIDCEVGTAGNPIAMVLYSNMHQVQSVANGHVVTAFVATSPGLKLAFSAAGCVPNPEIPPPLCHAWQLQSCTFTAI